MSDVVRKWGGLSSLIAGSSWLLIWIHQQQAHGTTQLNEMRVVWGLTWMDSSKLLVLSLGLVAVGLAGLTQRRTAPGRLGQAGRALTFTSLGALMLATMLEFWTFPWGSYEVTFEQATGLAGSNASGAIQSLVSLVLTIGMAVLCLDLVRSKVISIWFAVVLVAGALTTVFLSPVIFFPGVAWIALGVVVWPRREKSDVVAPVSAIPAE